MQFSERLKTARKECHLTQKQVAEALGISEGSYCSYEKAKREPNIEKIRILADLFDVSADFLINTNKYNKDVILNETEKHLIKIYRDFNKAGQEKLIDTIDDMELSGKYKKLDTVQNQKEA